MRLVTVQRPDHEGCQPGVGRERSQLALGSGDWHPSQPMSRVGPDLACSFKLITQHGMLIIQQAGTLTLGGDLPRPPQAEIQGLLRDVKG